MKNQTAQTNGGDTPELSVVPGPGNAADGKGASENANTPDAAELAQIRATVAQMAENQKLLHAALRALGTRDDGDEDDEPVAQAPAFNSDFDLPEEEGYEKLNETWRPAIKREVMANRQMLQQAITENKKLREEISKMRREDHFGFFQASTPGWEKYDNGMAEIFQTLDVQPKDTSTFKYVLGIAKDREEVKRLRAENEALKKAGPVPRLQSARPGIREKLGKRMPDRGAGFGPGSTFLENLSKVRLRNDQDT